MQNLIFTFIYYFMTRNGPQNTRSERYLADTTRASTSAAPPRQHKHQASKVPRGSTESSKPFATSASVPGFGSWHGSPRARLSTGTALHRQGSPPARLSTGTTQHKHGSARARLLELTIDVTTGADSASCSSQPGRGRFAIACWDGGERRPPGADALRSCRQAGDSIARDQAGAGEGGAKSVHAHDPAPRLTAASDVSDSAGESHLCRPKQALVPEP